MSNFIKFSANCLLCCFFSSVIWLSACASNSSSDNNDKSTGTYQAKLIFPSYIPRLTSESKSGERIDCRAAGITSIEFYFSVNGEQHQPHAFDCIVGGGIVKDVPAGEEVMVEIFANDVEGIPLLKGAEVVTVTPGQKTVGGEITMEYVSFADPSASIDTAPQSGQDGTFAPNDDSVPSEDQGTQDSPSSPDTDAQVEQSAETSELDADNQTEENTPPENDTPPEPNTGIPAEQDTSPAPTPTPASAPVESFRNAIGMQFMRIPAGTFRMGSPINELGRAEDETLHQVTITQDFYIQTTEVTQRQWTTAGT